jgi:hypothetical protein
MDPQAHGDEIGFARQVAMRWIGYASEHKGPAGLRLSISGFIQILRCLEQLRADPNCPSGAPLFQNGELRERVH